MVGVTGGAAAIKSPFLLRRLREAGHEVRVAATEDAYHFVTPLTLSLASGGPVLDRSRWFEPHGRGLHLEWGEWCDLLLVAPASADALASAANGQAHDVVSALVLAGDGRVAWAPAMNGRMWQQPAVQRNVERLRADGHDVLGPDRGAMAAVGEAEGLGRMLEPEELVAGLEDLFLPRDLDGRSVLVSAGPTHEYLDPVRFLSNPSSGKMGFEVARAAVARGAAVTLVSGPTSLAVPRDVEFVPVVTAEQMRDAIEASFAGCDVLVMAAAVADWRARKPEAEKQPKLGEAMDLELVRTPDILGELARARKSQVMVGFAMETDQGVTRAADKARRKGLDFICLNYPTREGSGFGGDENEVTFVTPAGASERLPRMSKRSVAHRLLDRVVRL